MHKPQSFQDSRRQPAFRRAASAGTQPTQGQGGQGASTGTQKTNRQPGSSASSSAAGRQGIGAISGRSSGTQNIGASTGTAGPGGDQPQGRLKGMSVPGGSSSFAQMVQQLDIEKPAPDLRRLRVQVPPATHNSHLVKTNPKAKRKVPPHVHRRVAL